MPGTPEELIDLLVKRMAAPSTQRMFRTRLERSLFVAALILYGAGLVVGGVGRRMGEPAALPIGWFLLLLASCVMFAYQIAWIFPDIRKAAEPDRVAISGFCQRFPIEYSLAAELARDYPPEMLAHARRGIEMEARHMRERIALICGQIDKVGVLPTGHGLFRL